MPAKDKDRILREISEYKPHNEIVGLYDVLSELKSHGYVMTIADEQGKLIVVRITQKGKEFLSSGGYSKHTCIDRFTRLKNTINSSIGRIVEAIIISFAILIIGWWIKTHYGISDNPECGEQSLEKNDSTFLSSESPHGLNEDSVASLGKSRTVCLDSSNSTLGSDSISAPSIDKSAVHSMDRDESKAAPSGKL